MNISCPVCSRKKMQDINIIFPEKKYKGFFCPNCQVCFIGENEYNSVKKLLDKYRIRFKYPILRMKNRSYGKQYSMLNTVIKSPKTTIEDKSLNVQKSGKSKVRQEDSSCKYYKHGKCLFCDDKCNINSVRCAKFKGGSKKKYSPPAPKYEEVENPDKFKNLPKIDLRDFVVRSNVFKCTHSHHRISNIDAAVTVIESSGKETKIKIPAGYCKQCHVYFIMESTYQELKRKGIILCRISDEKAYLKSGLSNGMKLAQESILMQYGYNVSQTEGLFQRARQQILAVLIDNKILSKSEIISYLDFFISQRAGRSNMEIAISKWETDREFVENYRIGEYTQYGINAIYRR